MPNVVDPERPCGRGPRRCQDRAGVPAGSCFLRLALQMARDDYEDRRERQRQGIELAKEVGKYRGRRGEPKLLPGSSRCAVPATELPRQPNLLGVAVPGQTCMGRGSESERDSSVIAIACFYTVVKLQKREIIKDRKHDIWCFEPKGRCWQNHSQRQPRCLHGAHWGACIADRCRPTELARWIGLQLDKANLCFLWLDFLGPLFTKKSLSSAKATNISSSMAPPRVTDLARSAIMASDIVVIPVQPSP